MNELSLKVSSMYLHHRVTINSMTGESDYSGRTGIVTFVDDIGQLHGTWGGLALVPGVDDFIINEDLNIYSVGFDQFSLRDDCGIVTGRCFIYSSDKKNSLSCVVREFTWYTQVNELEILCCENSSQFKFDFTFTSSELKKASDILLENLRNSVDVHLIKSSK